jgi:hypothetical protein
MFGVTPASRATACGALICGQRVRARHSWTFDNGNFPPKPLAQVDCEVHHEALVDGRRRSRLREREPGHDLHSVRAARAAARAHQWDTAWRALRDAAGLPGFRFHDLRHTVITELAELGVADHVLESISGHLSRRMLEHYSHIRIDAKRQALDALDEALRGAEKNGNASGGEAGDTTGDAPEPPDSDADIPLC